LCFQADSLVEITDTAGRMARIEMGYQQWKTSAVNAYPLNARYQVQNQFSTIRPPFRVGACYAWFDNEMQAKLHYVDWMASVQLRLRFSGDTVRIEAKENYQQQSVTFIGLTQEPALPL
jgi:hypothetical protein